MRLLQQINSAFTLASWWQSYGLALLAGLFWLLVGFILLVRASDWAEGVTGLTMLPPSMLLLLYGYWGHTPQQAEQDNLIFQALWLPSFALFGAALIHLSLIYRPSKPAYAHINEIFPYLPLIALVAYEWGSFLIQGHVPLLPNLLLSLGYMALGALLFLGMGLYSLAHLRSGVGARDLPEHIRLRSTCMLPLWLGAIIVGFCFGILTLLPNGQPFFPLPAFLIFSAIYPLILLYTTRQLRITERLSLALEQREVVLGEQQRHIQELQRANTDLQRATSLLLRADAHLRSTLSQRMHNQPRQQALRIRSLLAHWQHKMRTEAERDPDGKVEVQPLINALGKVRKISEELEGDLHGLQLLVEDSYQRRSLGLKLHLEKLIREDLPALHPESPLKVQADLWALDALPHDLEESEEGMRAAEAISYTVTQALLNIYNHAGASFATVRTVSTNGSLDIYIIDDGRGFDLAAIAQEKTSLFKAQLKAREAGGSLSLKSISRPQSEHGTTVILHLPRPHAQKLPEIQQL